MCWFLKITGLLLATFTSGAVSEVIVAKFGNLDAFKTHVCYGGTLIRQCPPADDGTPQAFVALSNWNLSISSCTSKCCPNHDDENVILSSSERANSIYVKQFIDSCRYKTSSCRRSFRKANSWLTRFKPDDRMLYVSIYYVCVKQNTPGQECIVDSRMNAYSGTLSSTIDGRTCEKWKKVKEKGKDAVDAAWFPESSLNHTNNYCRNPLSNDKGLYCYVSSKHVNKTYEVVACKQLPACRVTYKNVESVRADKLAGLTRVHKIIIGSTVGIVLLLVFGVIAVCLPRRTQRGDQEATVPCDCPVLTFSEAERAGIEVQSIRNASSQSASGLAVENAPLTDSESIKTPTDEPQVSASPTPQTFEPDDVLTEEAPTKFKGGGAEENALPAQPDDPRNAQYTSADLPAPETITAPDALQLKDTDGVINSTPSNPNAETANISVPKTSADSVQL